MTRGAKKALALAVGGMAISGLIKSPAQADGQATTVWTASGAANGTNQNFLNPANWTNGVPTSTDAGVFTTAAIPPKSVVNGITAQTVNISTSTSAGAIIDTFPSATGNQFDITGPTSGSALLSLYGVPYTSVQSTGTYNESNVVLDMESPLTNHLDTMDIAQSINISLVNAANTVIAGAGTASASGQTLQIDGNILNGPGVTSALTILGGGTGSVTGGTVYLTGTNAFSGGITVGTGQASDVPQANAQGAALEINPDGTASGGNINGSLSVVSNNTGTGNVVINEQGQILLNTATNASGGIIGGGTYYFMNTNQTLALNGIGENKTNSGALRTAPAKGPNVTDVILASVVIGSSQAIDGYNGDVIISSTKIPGVDVQFYGPVTGSGGIDKQGAGTIEFANPNNNLTGPTQLGNGVVQVDAGSSMGSGDLIMAETSNNITLVNLYNTTQNVGSLSSTFSQGSLQNLGTTLAYTQTISLYGTNSAGSNLILHQNETTSYGYTSQAGFNTLTSTIAGPGTLTLASTSTGTLTLTGGNSYAGGTYINGGTLVVANGYSSTGQLTLGGQLVFPGSATGTGDVYVGSGGTLSSGNYTQVLGTNLTAGSLSGNVHLSGALNPGGIGLIGQLYVGGNLIANTGSKLNFDLLGATNASADSVQITGKLLGDGTNGNVNLNINGPGLALGSYNLITAQTASGTLPNIVLNTTPTANSYVQRTYQLTTTATGVTLTVNEAGTDRFWSPGGVNPQADGSGTWSQGGGNFLNETGAGGINTFAATPYQNTALNDVIIGNGGNAGQITLGSNIIVQGPLGFNPVNGSYTIAGSNTLQLNGGIVSANNTTISAPIVLGAAGLSNKFTASLGTTLTLSGGISEGTIPDQSLTTADAGTIILGGTGAYTGGTTVSQGVLQVTTASLPSTGGVNIQSAGSLVFSQGSNGSYGGLISGSGAVTINNTNNAITTLGNASNSYTGGTVITGGVLSVSNISALGTNDGGITLNGGTLQAAGNLSFPLVTANNPASTLVLNSNTSSTIDTQSFNITMGPILSGAGNLTKIGSGTLTLSNIHSTNVIGTLAITGGALVFNESGDPSFGFSGSASSNAFTGDLDINQPTDLRIYAGNVSGGGNLNIGANANGTIIEGRESASGAGLTVIGNAINVLGNGSTIEFETADNGDELNLAGPITGNVADIDFTAGTATSSIVLSAQSNYIGETTVDLGSGTEVKLGISNALPATTELHLTNVGTFDLNGFNQTVFSLDANGSNNSALVNNESRTTSSVLTINGTTSTVYDGLFEDQYLPSSGITASLGITLNQTNGGSLTLTNNNVLPGGNGSVGLSGPINIISGRLDLQALTALGAPQTVTVGQTANNSQLRFDGVSGTVTYSDLGNPTVAASAVSYVLNGLGGFTSYNSSDVATGVDPGAISVENGSAVVLPNAVSVTAVSGIQIDNTSSLQITGNVTGAGGLVVSGGGPLTLSTVNLSSGIAVSNPAALNLTANATLGNTAGTGAITGSAALTVGTSNAPANLVLSKNSGVSSVASLTLSGTSQLDITNNALTINYGSAANQAAADASVRAYLVSGYNTDTWTGPGIVSSTAAANPGLLAVGYADGNSAAGTPAGPNQIYIKETLAGDANLDGIVNFPDLLLVAQNYGKTGQDWAQGDFNYDGVVNFPDLLLVAQNYGKQLSTAQLAELPSSFSSQWQLAESEVVDAGNTNNVPEPATTSLLAVATAGLLARRRRRTN